MLWVIISCCFVEIIVSYLHLYGAQNLVTSNVDMDSLAQIIRFEYFAIAPRIERSADDKPVCLDDAEMLEQSADGYYNNFLRCSRRNITN